jgi:hypothetical protein
MFQDKDRFEAHFIKTDILLPNPELDALKGKVDFVSAFQVIHSRNWDG